MADMSQATDEVQASSQANAPKDSRLLYEVGYHVVSTVDEAGLGSAVDALKAEIAKAGGEIVGEQPAEKLILSYIIERATSGKREKYSESYFGWIRFRTEERAGIQALEAYLQQTRNILRFLLIETVPEEAVTPRRAVFSSNRLEGETIKKPTSAPEAPVAEISEEDLNKSIDALVN